MLSHVWPNVSRGAAAAAAVHFPWHSEVAKESCLFRFAAVLGATVLLQYTLRYTYCS